MSIEILIADDHTLFRRGLVDLLTRAGGLSVVAEAEEGRAAVEQACRLQPDVVLLDLCMPGLNGLDATRQLLAREPAMRVLGLSARADARSVGQLLEAGASGYLPKTATVEEVVEAVRAVARGEVFLGRELAGPVIDQYVRHNRGRADGNGDGHGQAPELTAREREVLQLVAEGHAIKQIAGRLSVSVKTVETHRASVMRKLNLPSIAHLTKYAVREGITELEA